LIAVSDEQMPYLTEVERQMKAQGIRVQLDRSGERMQKQIRKAELEKIPVMAIAGNKEVESGSLSLRTRGQGELGVLTTQAVMDKLLHAIKTKGWL
jgi:threonyl-tRNA synthetase (EC 6.1.1.3)/Ser-tRNA(Thr) hydrolase (EC 3.1.1.-)